MFHTFPSPMAFPPCRIRTRNALVSSVYHNSPLFSGLIAALDDGLNRHNPCPCHSCQAIRRNKRTSVQHQDAPPSKRARTRSPHFSSFTSSQPSVIHCCQKCAFPDLPSRQTCRECGRRRAPPAMVQRFNVERTQPPKPSIHSPTTDTDTSPFTDADTLSFVGEHLMPQSYIAFAEHETEPPVQCGFHVSSQYQSHPLPELHVSVPVPASVPAQQFAPNVPSAALQYASPQSTIPDPAHFTDLESICSPESRSMASKSINNLDKQTFAQNHQVYTDEAELDVERLIEEVSNELSEQSNGLKEMDSARLSLVGSALSVVTCESVVALGGSQDTHEHSKAIHDQKALPYDENAAEMFLNEIIMSGDENNKGACNDIVDLSLPFLDGMFPSLHEQNVC